MSGIGIVEVLSIASSLVTISEHLPNNTVDENDEPVVVERVNYGAPVLDLSMGTPIAKEAPVSYGAYNIQTAKVNF